MCLSTSVAIAVSSMIMKCKRLREKLATTLVEAAATWPPLRFCQLCVDRLRAY